MTTGTFSYSWAVLPQPPPLSTSEATPTSASARHPPSNVNNSLGVHTPPLTGHPSLLAHETEIFVPEQLARGRRLIVEGLREGDTYTYDVRRQTLFVLPRAQTQIQLGGEQGNAQAYVVHNVTVRFDPPLRGEIPNDLWTDFATPVTAVLVVLLALIAYFS
jgi:hypothetical protein